MYSSEIQNILEQNKYRISSNVFFEIFDLAKSTQIIKMKYDPFNNCYEVWTNDNHYWKFTVINE